MSPTTVLARELPDSPVTPRPQSDEHLAYLDAMRGVAIAAVVLVHVGLQIPGLAPSLRSFCHAGQYGVQLFFVVSALTLMMSLSRRHDNSRTAFFIRRVCRIAPMYLLGLVFYSLLRYFLQGKFPQLGSMLTAATFTNGCHPRWISDAVPGGWSVTNEMMFYLLVPTLYTRIRNWQTSAGLTLVAALGGVGLTWWLTTPSFSALARSCTGLQLGFLSTYIWSTDWFLYLWFPMHLPVFLSGILAFQIQRRYGRRIGPRTAACLLAGALLLAGVAAWAPGIGLVRHLVASSGAVLLVLSCGAVPWQVFVNPVLSYLGKVSYSLYLVHFCLLDHLALPHIQTVAAKSLVPPVILLVISFVVVLIVSAGVATITYWAVEKPGMAFGRRLIQYTKRGRGSA